MSTEQTNLEQLQKENDRLKAQIELLKEGVRELYSYAGSDKPLSAICSICDECYTAYADYYEVKDCCIELKKKT